MTLRRWLLVGVGLVASAFVGFGLWEGQAKGAEAQARPAVSGPAIKVGIVDLRRAFQESKAVLAAKTRLIQERNEKLQTIKARQEEIKRLVTELRNQGALLSEVVKRQKEAEFRRKQRRLERFASDSEQELNRQYLSIHRLFLADARKEILALGNSSGYTIIVDVNNDFILYGAQSVDLTDHLIQRMNDHQ